MNDSGKSSWWRQTFLESLEEVDAEMRTRLAASPGVIDAKTAWVMLSATAALALQRYTSNPTDFLFLVEKLPMGESTRASARAWLTDIEFGSRFGDLAWWVGTTIVTYILIPVVVVKLVFRERLVDYGAGFRRSTTGWPIYALMAVFMVPIVWAASTTEAFLFKYPFFRLEKGEPIPREFWWWELLYAWQFIGLEFFFRGFMVHGLKHRFGSAAVLVMTTPYCMIHFGKPMAETFAAIFAGLALGVMSLKTGTIWMGAALHIMVAWTMDALALYRGGFFG
jgi:uncharacterized protein